MSKLRALVYFLLALLLMSCIRIPGMRPKSTTSVNIDTLEVFSDHYYVNVKVYENERLRKEEQGLMYPKDREVPRYKLTGKLIMMDFFIDSLVSHGETKEYMENGWVKIIQFDKGKMVNVNCFNQAGESISQSEFDGLCYHNMRCGPPRNLGTHTLMYRPEKKRKRDKNPL